VRLCAISVDLDEIPNYFQIHGLEAPEGASTAVYDVAVDRLTTFARDASLPLTLFATDALRDRRRSRAPRSGGEVARRA
jgi:hypothetical protein